MGNEGQHKAALCRGGNTTGKLLLARIHGDYSEAFAFQLIRKLDGHCEHHTEQ